MNKTVNINETVADAMPDCWNVTVQDYIEAQKKQIALCHGNKVERERLGIFETRPSNECFININKFHQYMEQVSIDDLRVIQDALNMVSDVLLGVLNRPCCKDDGEEFISDFHDEINDLRTAISNEALCFQLTEQTKAALLKIRLNYELPFTDSPLSIAKIALNYVDSAKPRPHVTHEVLA